MRPAHDYESIDEAWFLGDEGELEDEVCRGTQPSNYFHPQYARLFLEYIQLGLTDAQAAINVPVNITWVKKWMRGSLGAPSGFTLAAHKARQIQVDEMAMSTIDIADGTDLLVQTNALIETVDNPLRKTLIKSVRMNNEKWVKKHASDRINARRWVASKLRSDRYGDKVQLDHGNAGGKPFRKLDYSNMTDEQIDALMKLDKELAERGDGS